MARTAKQATNDRIGLLPGINHPAGGSPFFVGPVLLSKELFILDRAVPQTDIARRDKRKCKIDEEQKYESARTQK